MASQLALAVAAPLVMDMFSKKPKVPRLPMNFGEAKLNPVISPQQSYIKPFGSQQDQFLFEKQQSFLNQFTNSFASKNTLGGE